MQGGPIASAELTDEEIAYYFTAEPEELSLLSLDYWYA